MITGLLSCSPGTHAEPVEIHFGIAPEAVADGVIVRSLQFYIHDVELLDEQGTPHPLRLTAAAPWQAEAVALVDLAGNAEAQRHSTISGTPPSGASTSYAGIRFTVGVPFALNHANPLTAAAPLDRGDLFWTWQSGYKFLRADFAAQGRESSFHLGSTGCSSASALRPPAMPCAQPNRMRVELKGDPVGGVIRFHLAALVAAALAANHAACAGNYAHDPACRDAYASTALQPDSGVCPDDYCARQKLWTLE